MLNKKYRLSKKEILNIVKLGKRFSTENIDIKVWFDEKLEFPQFCFIVSKKVSKDATDRNKIKRILRAEIYKLIKTGKVKNAKYVFIVKKPLERINLSEIEAILK